jgi:hypothetical protein
MMDLAEMFATPEEVQSITSIAQLEELAAKIRDEELLEDQMKAAYKEQSDKATVMRMEMLRILKDAGKTKYSSNVGTFSIAQKTSVKVPKEWNAKEKLFSWLKAKGDEFYWTYVTVNSQSLNSLYREEFAKAEDKASFSIDGVEEPIVMEELRFRKQ